MKWLRPSRLCISILNFISCSHAVSDHFSLSFVRQAHFSLNVFMYIVQLAPPPSRMITTSPQVLNLT